MLSNEARAAFILGYYTAIQDKIASEVGEKTLKVALNCANVSANIMKTMGITMNSKLREEFTNLAKQHEDAQQKFIDTDPYFKKEENSFKWGK